MEIKGTDGMMWGHCPTQECRATWAETDPYRKSLMAHFIHQWIQRLLLSCARFWVKSTSVPQFLICGICLMHPSRSSLARHKLLADWLLISDLLFLFRLVLHHNVLFIISFTTPASCIDEWEHDCFPKTHYNAVLDLTLIKMSMLASYASMENLWFILPRCWASPQSKTICSPTSLPTQRCKSLFCNLHLLPMHSPIRYFIRPVESCIFTQGSYPDDIYKSCFSATSNVQIRSPGNLIGWPQTRRKEKIIKAQDKGHLYEAFRVATEDKDCARDAAVITSTVSRIHIRCRMFAPTVFT